MILASIGARRRNRDPLPYVLPSGERVDSPYAPMDDPTAWVHADGSTWREGEPSDDVRLRDLGATYAPRADLTAPATHPANPLLDLSRDTAGDSDVWGWAMGWAFTACAVLEYLGEPVPAEYGYHPSFAGAASDLLEGSWEATATLAALGLGGADTVADGNGEPEPAPYLLEPEEVPAETWRMAGEYARHAAAVWNRYLDACKRAGLDY